MFFYGDEFSHFNDNVIWKKKKSKVFFEKVWFKFFIKMFFLAYIMVFSWIVGLDSENYWHFSHEWWCIMFYV
jgi:hypothetical protein